MAATYSSNSSSNAHFVDIRDNDVKRVVLNKRYLNAIPLTRTHNKSEKERER